MIDRSQHKKAQKKDKTASTNGQYLKLLKFIAKFQVGAMQNALAL